MILSLLSLIFQASYSCAQFCVLTHMSSGFFLGVLLDLVTMTMTLLVGNVTWIQDLGHSLLWWYMFSIHDLASLIGQVVFASLAVPQASLRYNNLEFMQDIWP